MPILTNDKRDKLDSNILVSDLEKYIADRRTHIPVFEKPLIVGVPSDLRATINALFLLEKNTQSREL